MLRWLEQKKQCYINKQKKQANLYELIRKLKSRIYPWLLLLIIVHSNTFIIIVWVGGIFGNENHFTIALVQHKCGMVVNGVQPIYISTTTIAWKWVKTWSLKVIFYPLEQK